MKSHHKHWDAETSVDKFATKTAQDFFKSEVRFIAEVGAELTSVLDVGCASGRLIELLKEYRTAPFRFVGVDLADNSIARAKALYPEHEFFTGDALDLDITGTFDLVNATGVCQHEPRFAELLDRMLAWSNRYVLFDAKLSDVAEDISDLSQAYCDHDPPFFFIVKSLSHLLGEIASRPEVRRVSLFGYETKKNAVTVLPPHVTRLVSTGVFLEKGPARTERDALEVRLELPGFLLAAQKRA